MGLYKSKSLKDVLTLLGDVRSGGAFGAARCQVAEDVEVQWACCGVVLRLRLDEG